MTTTYVVDSAAIEAYRQTILPIINSRLSSLNAEIQVYNKAATPFNQGYVSALKYAASLTSSIKSLAESKNAEAQISREKDRRYRLMRFTNENQKKHFAWRAQVLLRDNNSCRKCGSRQGIEAHHIYSVKEEPSLAHDINNGVALCWACHRKFHKDYGRTAGAADELLSFIIG
jgi:5-methylcytosine-specific restriction endonuclease McrA